MTSQVRLVNYFHSMPFNCCKIFFLQDSFQSVQNWIEDVYRYAEGNVQLAVVGNKRDLPREKQVVNATSGMVSKKFAKPEHA